ncbi:hypothetical protein PR048_031762 [Dryococelus australis]|uniref:Uncharacterized protein n=1 Tax=Dryococelus australis TaxID=614101 RepID=A0ABQ9G664_9NEOP|nr:hypothetical protein PR048_031762 [Dryococelus australis]
MGAIECEHRAAPERRGRGKREIPEKTRRPTASYGTIPTCEKSGDPNSERDNRARRCRWSAGFLKDLRFLPHLHSVAAPHSPRFTLIGSQNLVVKSRTNIFTPISKTRKRQNAYYVEKLCVFSRPAKTTDAMDNGTQLCAGLRLRGGNGTRPACLPSGREKARARKPANRRRSGATAGGQKWRENNPRRRVLQTERGGGTGGEASKHAHAGGRADTHELFRRGDDVVEGRWRGELAGKLAQDRQAMTSTDMR